MSVAAWILVWLDVLSPSLGIGPPPQVNASEPNATPQKLTVYDCALPNLIGALVLIPLSSFRRHIALLWCNV